MEPSPTNAYDVIPAKLPEAPAETSPPTIVQSMADPEGADIPDEKEPSLTDVIATIQKMTTKIDELTEARRLMKVMAEKMLKKL